MPPLKGLPPQHKRAPGRTWTTQIACRPVLKIRELRELHLRFYFILLPLFNDHISVYTDLKMTVATVL